MTRVLQESLVFLLGVYDDDPNKTLTRWQDYLTRLQVVSQESLEESAKRRHFPLVFLLVSMIMHLGGVWLDCEKVWRGVHGVQWGPSAMAPLFSSTRPRISSTRVVPQYELGADTVARRLAGLAPMAPLT